jgi:hypothetical protein
VVSSAGLAVSRENYRGMCALAPGQAGAVAACRDASSATGYLATNTGRSARLTTSADTDRENKRDSQLR